MLKATILKVIRWVVGVFFASTILAVIAYRFVPVYLTPLMVIRCVENGNLTIHHHWIPLEEMSPHMPVAAMAGEDGRFLLHHGFDFEAIGEAAKHNINGGKRRGGSTITQQTAKNVFLWPGSSTVSRWVRKGFEAYFTFLIELFWSKQRIMEVYLNSIEMGDQIYGIDACAELNFGKSAAELSRADCALIAATFPNPHRFSSKTPSPYVRKRQRAIMANMRYIPSFPKEGEDYDPDTAQGSTYK